MYMSVNANHGIHDAIMMLYQTVPGHERAQCEALLLREAKGCVSLHMRTPTVHTLKPHRVVGPRAGQPSASLNVHEVIRQPAGGEVGSVRWRHGSRPVIFTILICYGAPLLRCDERRHLVSFGTPATAAPALV